MNSIFGVSSYCNESLPYGVSVVIASLEEAYYLYRQHAPSVDRVSGRFRNADDFFRRLSQDCPSLYEHLYGDTNPDQSFDRLHNQFCGRMRQRRAHNERLQRREDGHLTLRDRFNFGLDWLHLQLESLNSSSVRKPNLDLQAIHINPE
ncbi:MAG: hypothetical protein H6860_01735 [Rhodospirillales bacterium]|nr:hypothetical protein [Alphaproteobacteria bacterium]MCB9981101.1 hypothetical protein [Rhodospirillales bacterium]